MINPNLVGQTPVTQVIIHTGCAPQAITNQPSPLSNRRKWTNSKCGCFNNFCYCIFAFFCPLLFELKLFRLAEEDISSCVFGGLVPLRTRIRAERGINVKTNM